MRMRMRMRMSLLALFRVLFMKEWIYLKRYYFNTISAVITIYLVFLIIFFGAKALGAGQAGSGFGSTLEGIVVGFLVWTFALFAYSELSWALIQEAQQGTLEQLYMSPLGFGWVAVFRVASTFLVNSTISALLLLLMMASSGKWLHLDLLSLAPLLILTVLGVYGVGFLMGGLALVFKRVEASFQILQFVFVALIAAPADRFPWVNFLPLAYGTQLIGRVMIEGTPIGAMPLNDLLFLAANAAFYFGAGFLVFKVFEGVARDRGLLGHY